MLMAKKKKQQDVNLTVEWNIPNNMASTFVTNFLIQKIEDEFKILFFEIKPPIVLNETDREEVKKRGTVRADCVGGIVVTPDRLVKFVEILNEQLSMYNKAREKKES
jgi:hypothetical protein